METGKTGKYFKYAIGEIVLVVIGILIALQINNWNQSRLEKQTEKQILKDLKVEFDANFSDLKRVIRQHKIVFNEFSEIQRITNTNTYNGEILDSLVFSTTKWFSFTQRPGASENLINSGNLSIISNKTLRDLLTQWSGVVDDVIDDESYGNEFTRNTFLPFIAKHIPVTNLEYPHYKFYLTNVKGKSLNGVPIIKPKAVDWEQFLNNIEFQSLLSLRKTYEMHSIDEAEIALDYCEKIINQLKIELAK